LDFGFWLKNERPFPFLRVADLNTETLCARHGKRIGFGHLALGFGGRGHSKQCPYRTRPGGTAVVRGRTDFGLKKGDECPTAERTEITENKI